MVSTPTVWRAERASDATAGFASFEVRHFATRCRIPKPTATYRDLPQSTAIYRNLPQPIAKKKERSGVPRIGIRGTPYCYVVAGFASFFAGFFRFVDFADFADFAFAGFAGPKLRTSFTGAFTTATAVWPSAFAALFASPPVHRQAAARFAARRFLAIIAERSTIERAMMSR